MEEDDKAIIPVLVYIATGILTVSLLFGGIYFFAVNFGGI